MKNVSVLAKINVRHLRMNQLQTPTTSSRRRLNRGGINIQTKTNQQKCNDRRNTTGNNLKNFKNLKNIEEVANKTSTSIKRACVWRHSTNSSGKMSIKNLFLISCLFVGLITYIPAVTSTKLSVAPKTTQDSDSVLLLDRDTTQLVPSQSFKLKLLDSSISSSSSSSPSSSSSFSSALHPSLNSKFSLFSSLLPSQPETSLTTSENFPKSTNAKIIEKNIPSKKNGAMVDDGGEESDSVIELLPQCESTHSVCGVVQLNPAGLTQRPVCECPNEACRMGWNPFDNNGIRHGNDFYKYCNRKPRLPLCVDGQAALVEESLLDSSARAVSRDQRLLCQCKGDHLLLNDPLQAKFEQLDDGGFMYSTLFRCQKPPRCGRRQDCALITVEKESNKMFVKQNCRCTSGKVCPNNLRYAFDIDELNVHHMRCV